MGKEVITVEAEEIPIEKTVEKSFLTALEKHEINKKFLEEKRDECLKLTIVGQDKEAYTLVRETRLNMKASRVAIEKICKKGREDATKTQKAWIAIEKDYVKIVSEGEDYLSELEEKFESEAERIKAEAKRKQEEEFIHRQTDLTKMGATYVDGNFVLNDISYEAILIKEADDEVWIETIRPAYHKQYLKNEEKKIQEEKERLEAAAEIERQRQEQEAKQKELEAREAEIRRKEQEEIDRIEALAAEKKLEAASKLEERTRTRSNELAALGLNYDGQQYVFKDVNVHWSVIVTFEDKEWGELIERIKPIIEHRKKEAEAKRLAEIEEEKRIAAELAVKKEQERVAEENRLAEEKRMREEARKAEEALKATDKTKWAAFISSIEAIQLPEMKHHAYKQKMADAKKLISKIADL